MRWRIHGRFAWRVPDVPAVDNALLPILFLVSAVSTGMSSVLLVGGLKFPKEFDSVGVLKKFHYCFPIIELVLVASLCFITSYNSVAGSSR